MFGQEAERLLREDWPNATMLAQELYAIFQDSVPATTDAPITANSTNPDQAPIQINQYGDNGLVLSFGNGDGFAGGIILDDGVPTLVGPDKKPKTPSTIFPGQVVSGSGSSYQVNVYLSGLSSQPTQVTVLQLQIDSDDQIPANSWVLVGQSTDSSFFMQAPVWQ